MAAQRTWVVDAAGGAGSQFRAIVPLLGLPSQPASTPWGQLWIDPDAHLFVDCGVIPAGRSHSYALAHGAVPPGFTCTVQTVLFHGTVLLSTPSPVLFR